MAPLDPQTTVQEMILWDEWGLNIVGLTRAQAFKIARRVNRIRPNSAIIVNPAHSFGLRLDRQDVSLMVAALDNLPPADRGRLENMMNDAIDWLERAEAAPDQQSPTR